MSGPVKLSSPRYRVVLGDPADPASWAEFDVQSMTRDIAAAEALFARHKWGKTIDSPIKLTEACAFYALTRSGEISGSWEAFDARFIEVAQVEGDAVDPTPPDLEAGF